MPMLDEIDNQIIDDHYKTFILQLEQAVFSFANSKNTWKDGTFDYYFNAATLISNSPLDDIRTLYELSVRSLALVIVGHHIISPDQLCEPGGLNKSLTDVNVMSEIVGVHTNHNPNIKPDVLISTVGFEAKYLLRLVEQDSAHWVSTCFKLKQLVSPFAHLLADYVLKSK